MEHIHGDQQVMYLCCWYIYWNAAFIIIHINYLSINYLIISFQPENMNSYTHCHKGHWFFV